MTVFLQAGLDGGRGRTVAGEWSREPALSGRIRYISQGFRAIPCFNRVELGGHSGGLVIWVELGVYSGVRIPADTVRITPEILALIAEIDEFKGSWRALRIIAPERLAALRHVATIESIGSSTRIEGSKLTDREVGRLLTNLEIKSFASRDEQEVAGYADAVELVLRSWEEITITENHIKQLHRDVLAHSEKDERHRGSYKTAPNNVVALDENGKRLGIVLETA
ncbi:MAG TPA: hypothetical protein VH934_18105, partial [Xanthobacteraceae bacterium]